jgi:hypothetical protein
VPNRSIIFRDIGKVAALSRHSRKFLGVNGRAARCGAPRSNLLQQVRPFLPALVRSDRRSSAFPVVSCSNGRRHALCAGTADDAFEPELEMERAFDTLVQHRPFELAPEMAVAALADTIQSQVEFEYAKLYGITCSRGSPWTGNSARQ